MAPFDVVGATPEHQVDGITDLPETFPSTVAVIPCFQELVAEYRGDDRSLNFPGGHRPHAAAEGDARNTLTARDLRHQRADGAQMSDNHGWAWFPNFFMTIRARRAHIIMSLPHPDGDPNRCIWHVSPAVCGCRTRPKPRSQPHRSSSTRPAATSISKRCNRITSRCPDSRSGCATLRLSTWPWSGRSRHRALPFGHRQVPRIGRRPLLIHPASRK